MYTKLLWDFPVKCSDTPGPEAVHVKCMHQDWDIEGLVSIFLTGPINLYSTCAAWHAMSTKSKRHCDVNSIYMLQCFSWEHVRQSITERKHRPITERHRLQNNQTSGIKATVSQDKFISWHLHHCQMKTGIAEVFISLCAQLRVNGTDSLNILIPLHAASTAHITPSVFLKAYCFVDLQKSSLSEMFLCSVMMNPLPLSLLLFLSINGNKWDLVGMQCPWHNKTNRAIKSTKHFHCQCALNRCCSPA